MNTRLMGCRIGFSLGCLLLAGWGPAHSQEVIYKVPFTSGTRTLFADCYSNHDITIAHPAVERLIIVLHGFTPYKSAFTAMVAATGLARASATTLIIAPQFYSSWEGSATLYWHSSNPTNWRGGEEATNAPGISSFMVLDTLIERVTRLNPQIRKVTVAGQLVGAQMVNRYAAGTRLTEDIKIRKGVHIRYIMGNASSYLYLNEERRIPGSPDKFSIPSAASPTYDIYHYGLTGGLPPYMAAAGGKDVIRERFKASNSVILLNTADTGIAMLDNSYDAELQGKRRFERGINYHAYLGHFYGKQVYQTHKLALVPGDVNLWASKCGFYHLFDYGTCEDSASLAVTPDPRGPGSSWALWSGTGVRLQASASGDYRLSLYAVNGATAAVRDLRLEAGTPYEIPLERLGLLPAARYGVRIHRQ
jgi:hypothetical protein